MPTPTSTSASQKDNNNNSAGRRKHGEGKRVSTSAPLSSSLPPTACPPSPSPPPPTPHQTPLCLLSPLSAPTTTTGTYLVPELVQIERGALLVGYAAFSGARDAL